MINAEQAKSMRYVPPSQPLAEAAIEEKIRKVARDRNFTCFLPDEVNEAMRERLRQLGYDVQVSSTDVIVNW